MTPFETYHQWLMEIPKGRCHYFHRGKATLEVARAGVNQVTFRQGGRAGVWITVFLHALARAMDDGKDAWKKEVVK
jgi:hypothetical protein